jgi:uncharacterized protein YceK
MKKLLFNNSFVFEREFVNNKTLNSQTHIRKKPVNFKNRLFLQTRYVEIKNMKKIFLILLICLVLSGCLTRQKYSFRFDYKTGRAERLSYDIRSQKGADERDYSIEGDWKSLKSCAGENFGKEFDPEVIKPVKAELFKDGEVLSGKEIFEVQSPKAFPSKEALLEKLHAGQDESLHFQTINNEIFLFSNSKEIESSNGRIIKTDKNNIVVWPEDQLVFEFTLHSKSSDGKTLLPFYLKELEIKEKK